MAEKIAALYLRLSDEDRDGNLDESNSITAEILCGGTERTGGIQTDGVL